MDVDNLQNVSLVKFDGLSVSNDVTEIFIEPLLKCKAMVTLETLGAFLGVDNGNRHCECVVLKIWRRRVQAMLEF
jgi:hypothetical protein